MNILSYHLRYSFRSRILTLDGARYSITERKGGIGYVRDLIPFPLRSMISN